MAFYAAMVMIISFLVEMLLFLASDRLCGFSTEWLSMILACAIAGIYAGLCLLPGFRIFGITAIRYAILLLLVPLVYGISVSAISRGAVFLLLNMAVERVTGTFWIPQLLQLFLCVLSIILLCTIGVNGDKEGIPVEIRYNGRQVMLNALRDTGNTLWDPLTGNQVLVIGADAAKQLTDLTREQIRDPINTLTKTNITGLRLVPYQTINKGTGFMLAVRMGNVKIANREKAYLVAFAPEGLCEEGKYQALAGGII